MFDVFKTRLTQRKRTIGFPKKPPVLPDHFRGMPEIDSSLCREGCRSCADACPTDAIQIHDHKVTIDMGRCLFCPDCANACPDHVLKFTSEYRLASRERPDLVVSGGPVKLAEELDKKMRALLGRSLKLRQVSAGGCNACEADVNVLNTVVFDLGRFGVQFVASPRHADGLLITGPVTANMREALLKTYAAVPSPKIVIAVGACAISGGPFIGHPEVSDGVANVLPVDLFIPGCPPHPITILDGILRLLGSRARQTP